MSTAVDAESSEKVVVNLATGHEDADRVTVASVATAAAEQGRQVTMFLTKEAVRLAVPGYADAIESAGAPPVSRLPQQLAARDGQLFVCPICFSSRRLDGQALLPNARLAGATQLWEWIGGESATVFSY
jgi:predicted peroxiredoxin